MNDAFPAAQDTLFAHALARLALDHPTWEHDDFVADLVRKGFAREYVTQHGRAIAEAKLHAEKLGSGARA